jgi:hypothetical protein
MRGRSQLETKGGRGQGDQVWASVFGGRIRATEVAQMPKKTPKKKVKQPKSKA